METRAQAPERPSFPREPVVPAKARHPRGSSSFPRKLVIPAKAGIHSYQQPLDSRFRGNDGLQKSFPVGRRAPDDDVRSSACGSRVDGDPGTGPGKPAIPAEARLSRESPLSSRKPVVPAKAGIHSRQDSLDSRFRGNDGLQKSFPAGRRAPDDDVRSSACVLGSMETQAHAPRKLVIPARARHSCGSPSFPRKRESTPTWGPWIPASVGMALRPPSPGGRPGLRIPALAGMTGSRGNDGSRKSFIRIPCVIG